jgi:protein-S-isoprenylcysteine O-methyltransferase Ste14
VTHDRAGKRVWPLLGSLLFLIVAPGTLAGWIPFWLTNWRVDPPFLGLSILPFVGAVLALAGTASLVESFARFAFVGRGTPAPVAPPSQLVVSGQYRYVRNPIYVAVVAIVLGQSLILGSGVLLRYAGVLLVFFHLWVVLYEEQELSARFGQSYAEYRNSVRRWWPRVSPWRG